MLKRYMTVVIIFYFCLFGSFLMATPFSDAVSVNTISPSQTVVYFHLPEFTISECNEYNMTFAKIEMDGAFNSGDKGLPNLPHFSATLAIPIGSTPILENVTLSTPRYLQTLPIVPIQNTDADDYTFDYDTQFYQSKDLKTVYPQTSYFMSEIQTLRDYQFVIIKIYPVKYQPAEDKIEIIDSFQFTINHRTTSPSPQYTVRPFISKAFERIYEHTFQNYHQVRSPNPIYQESSILLIYGGTSSYHTATFMSYINNIVNLKKQKGFLVTAVSTATIGTTTTTIKSYIQNLYNNSPNPPEWIIMVGSRFAPYAVPCFVHTWSTYTNGHNDYAYTFLAGNDYLGDAFVGRISVSSENELNNYWQKIQKYELNSPATDPALYKKSLLVGHSGDSGMSTYIINRYIKSLIVEYDPTANIQEMYYSLSQTANLRNNFNAGQSIFNFRGFSGMDNFTYSNAINTNVLTNSITLTCSTGYYNDPGTSEGLIRQSYSGNPAGAILATGITTGGTETEYNNAENGGMFYAMYVMDVPTMGEALLYGKIFTTTVYPGNDHTLTTIHWTNLMGDPSLYYFKTAPKTFATTLPSTFPSGTQSFRFVVTDAEGNLVPDAWVTISKSDGSYVSKAISDTDGIAILPLDHLQTGAFFFAISKPGFHVKRSPATISGNDNISVTGTMIYDLAPGGNNSQTINPGETVNLSIKVKNFTSSNAANLAATITTQSEYVTISGDTTIPLGSLGAGLESLYNDAFTFSVSPLAPDKDLLPFTVVLSERNNSWTSYFLLEVKGIDLKVSSFSPSYLNIGNTTNLSFSLKNVGNIASGTLQATLIPHSPYISTTGTTVNIPNIPIGATVTQSTPFSVSVDIAAIAGMRLKADLHIFNATGFETDIPVDLPIGNKTVGDPTGPDDYGYVIYHSSDTNITERPTYNWINIANIGTNTGMSDYSAEIEEDQRIVTLPFIASFYGQPYDRLTICSNGWLAFGETAQKDFRNLPLPGPIAPRALIAPYWTDLVMGGGYGGGVYTYHHPTEHAFIVQFDKVKWVTTYPSSSLLTVSSDSVSFQVLIYDPVYNGTSLGDSKIKIQYRRFFQGLQGTDDNPIQFITVGIQDHTMQTGIQYAFNNTYSLGSNTISQNTALLITSPNVIPTSSPHLVFSQVVNPATNSNSVNYGTTSDLLLSVRNAGSTPAENVTFTLTTASADVAIQLSERTVTSIPSGSIFTIPEPFSVVVAENVPDQTIVPFFLSATTATHSWQMNFYVVINTSNITLTSIQMRNSSGAEVSHFQPGNAGSITLNFRNTGHLATNSGMLYIGSLNPLLSLATNQMVIPALNINATTSITSNIQIASDAPLRTLLPISYLLDTQGQKTSGSVSVTVGQIIEDFETGNLSAFSWENETSRPWTIVNTNPASGIYCAQSSIDITHNENSTLQIAWPTSSAGTIQFDYKVDCEQNYDYLRFYINNQLQGQWSGTTAWNTVSYYVPASATNILKWVYEKDYIMSSGQDRAWVDNIIFPTTTGGSVNIPLAYADTDEIDFEIVPINTTVSTTFTLVNLGNATLIGSFILSDFYSVDSQNIHLVPFSTRDFTISFCGDVSGEYSSVIAIYTNDPNHSVINIPVNAIILGVGETHLTLSQAVNPATDTNTLDCATPSDIIITVQNRGPVTIENVSFTLSTSSPDVQIDIAEHQLPLLSAQSLFTLPEPFTVTVSQSVPDQTSVPFTLTVATQNQSWQMNFSMIVNTPKLQMIGLVLKNSALQEVSFISPGENGSISINFTNIGHMPTQNGSIYVSSINPALSIDTSQIDIPVLMVNGSFSFVSAIHIDSDTPQNAILPLLYVLNTPYQVLTETVNIATGQIVESFETGDLSTFPWTPQTDRAWTIVSTNPATGQFCAESSTNTSHNQSSTLQISWPTSSSGVIQFSYKISSEYNGDFLKFYINDTLKWQWSGSDVTTWRLASFPLPANASNTLKWVYEKNGSLSSAHDRAWIDDIIFPTPAGDSYSNVPISLVSIDNIDFGIVQTDVEVSTTFTLRNIGSADLIGTISLPDSYSLDSEPLIDIPPLDTVEYTVSFYSSQLGDFNGFLQIATNDPIYPMINIPLRAVTTPNGESDLIGLPITNILKTNYPNPFNPSTTIAFDIAREGIVALEIYNVKGQRVKTLVNSVYSAGSHSVVWNGDDSLGKAVSSGIYFYRMTTSGYVSVRKMILMK